MHALPVASVDTVKDAHQLRIAACKLGHDGDYRINPSSGFDRTVDSLFKCGDFLEEVYMGMLQRRSSGNRQESSDRGC
jgi:hypothetical protein